MAFSKTGLASVLLGLLILAGVWFYAFQSSGLWVMLLVTVQGGVVLLGLFLVFIGLLMLLL